MTYSHQNNSLISVLLLTASNNLKDFRHSRRLINPRLANQLLQLYKCGEY